MEKVRFEAFNVEELRVLRRACYEAGAAFGDPGHTAAEREMKMNGEHFAGLTDYPHLTHGDVEDVDLDKLGNYLKNVTTSGLLVPDEGVEDYIREAAGLPKRLDDYVPMPGEDREPGKVRTTQKPKKDTGDKMGGLDDEEPEEDPEAVEKARKDLGRD